MQKLSSMPKLCILRYKDPDAISSFKTHKIFNLSKSNKGFYIGQIGVITFNNLVKRSGYYGKRENRSKYKLNKVTLFNMFI